jgi:hypothetical protein
VRASALPRRAAVAATEQTNKEKKLRVRRTVMRWRGVRLRAKIELE